MKFRNTDVDRNEALLPTLWPSANTYHNDHQTRSVKDETQMVVKDVLPESPEKHIPRLKGKRASLSHPLNGFTFSNMGFHLKKELGE